jgi:hypothetical protein
MIWELLSCVNFLTTRELKQRSTCVDRQPFPLWGGNNDWFYKHSQQRMWAFDAAALENVNMIRRDTVWRNVVYRKLHGVAEGL